MHVPNSSVNCTSDHETEEVIEAIPNLNLIYLNEVFSNHKSLQKCIGISNQIEVTIEE